MNEWMEDALKLTGMLSAQGGLNGAKAFLKSKSPTVYQCSLSAEDRGVTKNPAVDLKLILMHHFSRILRLDFSSVLSTSLNSYFGNKSQIPAFIFEEN